MKGLPNGKATGVDGIPNEVLKNGGPEMASSIRALFNWIRQAETIPTSWMRGMIATIYKDGPKEDPGNYRGISLLCHVGKYFSTTLSKRLYHTLENSNSISDEQGGFRLGRSTVDQAYILHECLMRRKHAKKSSYCFFLDVKKAFDTVWQDGLWKKMYEAGVKGKLWRLIRAIYKDPESCVIVDGEKTRWFGKGNESQGVRQGCPLSSILFDLYMDGLAQRLKALGKGLVLNGRTLASLLFADDVVLVAGSPDDLQEMINVVADYSKEWRFEENLRKCAVMKVPAKGDNKKDSGSLTFLGEMISTTDRYKYLGLWFHSSLSWSVHAKEMAAKGRKANRGLASVLKNRKVPARVRLEIWKVLVRTKIEYGTELWDTDTTGAKSLDAVQQEALSWILQCNCKTSAWAIRGETGVERLSTRRHAAKLRYRARLETMDDSRMTKHVFSTPVEKAQVSGKKQKKWHQLLDIAFETLDMDEHDVALHFDPPENDAPGPETDPYKAWKLEVRAAVAKRETTDFQEACTHQPKLHLQKALKTNGPTMEPWVAKTMDETSLIKLKLRLGTSGLAGDKARGLGANRHCMSCKQSHVENEAHLLLHCPAYDDLREMHQGLTPALRGLISNTEEDESERMANILQGSEGGLATPADAGTLHAFLRKVWERRNLCKTEAAETGDTESTSEESEEDSSSDESQAPNQITNYFTRVDKAGSRDTDAVVCVTGDVDEVCPMDISSNDDMSDTNDDEKSEGEGEEDKEALDEVEGGCTPDSVRGVDDQYDHDT
jgi:hypothetical protein